VHIDIAPRVPSVSVTHPCVLALSLAVGPRAPIQPRPPLAAATAAAPPPLSLPAASWLWPRSARRRDLFDAYNLSVPVTWEEFADLAQTMNGTDTDGDGVGDLWGVCLDNSMPTCKSLWILTAVLAPYVQYRGTDQVGWLYCEGFLHLRVSCLLAVSDCYRFTSGSNRNSTATPHSPLTKAQHLRSPVSQCS
jgi:hypothetical protein